MIWKLVCDKCGSKDVSTSTFTMSSSDSMSMSDWSKGKSYFAEVKETAKCEKCGYEVERIK